MDKKTKIVATIGPSSDGYKQIEELIMSGVNVFRFNTKHSDISWHNERIKRVQEVADKLKKVIAILIDLQGPEIRIETNGGENIRAKKGESFIIGDSFEVKEASIFILNKKVFKSLKKGDTLLIDDGFIEMRVIEKKNKKIKAEVLEGGIIKNRKSLNLPQKKLKLASLIDNDLKNLDMIAKDKIDFIALSFVRNKKDIDVLRKEMKKRKIEAMVVSKVENSEAIKNIDEIIDSSDAIMIARGDLGEEVPIEELAYLQKKIILKCRFSRKPVIVATQMLHSMIKNPRPTRAEATDIANAVFDETDAVMLSEETAIGKHPERSVSTMVKILIFNESKVIFKKLISKNRNSTEITADAIVSLIEAVDKSKVNNLIVFTESGYTARVISSFRPQINIIAATQNKKTAENLSISHGIVPYYSGSIKDFNLIIEKIKKDRLIPKDKRILILSGKHKNKPNLINSFSINRA